MSKVIILGSSNAVATEGHENTHMVVVGSDATVLIDCVGSPLVRLKQAGVEVHSITDVLLTHFHPDHVSGVPLLLMDMWLLGRRLPLNIHGLDFTLERIEALMGFYGWKSWPDFFPVNFRRVPSREMTAVVASEEFRILTSPVHHLIPTLGMRIEFRNSAKVLAYSCDTEPCDEVVRLAAGADVLIHEAAGRGRGHSSAEQAADTARQAEVRKLLLIHYPTLDGAETRLVGEAAAHFQGEIGLAEDFMVLEID